MTDYQDQWPKCATEGCTGHIYFDAEHRKRCRACELKGLAPRTDIPPLPEPYTAR
jgi:hypothetical protein